MGMRRSEEERRQIKELERNSREEKMHKWKNTDMEKEEEVGRGKIAAGGRREKREEEN